MQSGDTCSMMHYVLHVSKRTCLAATSGGYELAFMHMLQLLLCCALQSQEYENSCVQWYHTRRCLNCTSSRVIYICRRGSQLWHHATCCTTEWALIDPLWTGNIHSITANSALRTASHQSSGCRPPTRSTDHDFPSNSLLLLSHQPRSLLLAGVRRQLTERDSLAVGLPA